MFYDVLIATRLRFDKQSLPVVGPLPQSASVCLSLPQSASVAKPHGAAVCQGGVLNATVVGQTWYADRLINSGWGLMNSVLFKFIIFL